MRSSALAIMREATNSVSHACMTWIFCVLMSSVSSALVSHNGDASGGSGDLFTVHCMRDSCMHRAVQECDNLTLRTRPMAGAVARRANAWHGVHAAALRATPTARPRATLASMAPSTAASASSSSDERRRAATIVPASPFPCHSTLG
eukprot:6176153-Pleurochrysis_carterae.AAC.1